MDRGDGVLETAGRPVPLEMRDLASREHLAHRDRPAVRLGHQEAAYVHREHVRTGRRDAAALGLEEVGHVTRADPETHLGEGGLVPDDLGARQRGEAGGRLEPHRLLGIAVVVAHATVVVVPATGHEAGAGKARPVDAV